MPLKKLLLLERKKPRLEVVETLPQAVSLPLGLLSDAQYWLWYWTLEQLGEQTPPV